MNAMKLNQQDRNNGILVHVLEKRMTTSHARNEAFHPKSDVDGLYASTEDGGRGANNLWGCVRGEENSLGWYVRNSLDILLQGV